eukprot:GHVT01082884.1.p1 GENE.GHVT01082884.1~~GHVT01082884.1.p1  ORF type:complete len:484 (+),score=17.62 GHVT01082884.1:481-1932(+)
MAEDRCLLISNLTTYLPQWQVKGRVIDRSPLREIKNGASIFHVDIVDAKGSTIRAKFWNAAATKFHSTLEVGKVFIFSRGRVILADKKYNNLPGDYELSFDRDSVITSCEDDGKIRSRRRATYTVLRDIRNSTRETPYQVDLLVVVKDVGAISQVTTKHGTELARRNIRVVDDSYLGLDITTWGELAEKGDSMFVVDTVASITEVAIKDWKGTTTGSTSRNTAVTTEFDDAERAKKLQDWYNTEGISTSFASMTTANAEVTERSFIREELDIYDIIAREAEPEPSSNVAYVCKAWTSKIYHVNREHEPLTLMYPPCPSCKKKLNEQNGLYNCLACGSDDVKPEWKWIITAQVMDSTGVLNVKFFGDLATHVIGYPAKEVREWTDAAKQSHFDHHCLTKELTIVLRRGKESYGGKEKYIYSAVMCSPLDFTRETAVLLEKIRAAVPDATAHTKSRKTRRDSLSMEVDTESVPKHVKTEAPNISS